MKKKITASAQDKLIAELTAKNMRKNRGELYHVRLMNTEKLVLEYLLLGTITYTQRINCYDALRLLGYTTPKYDGRARVEFGFNVSSFASILKEKLTELGFKADREKRQRSLKNLKSVHTAKATVYTNVPPTVYYKARKAMDHAENTMRANHSRSIEMDVFEKNFSLDYRNGEVVLAKVHNAGSKLEKANISPKEAFSTFVKNYEPSKEEVFEFFKDRSTEKYKRFMKKGGFEDE